MEDKSANSANDKRLISKIHRQLIQYNTTETTQSENGQKTSRSISPQKNYR